MSDDTQQEVESFMSLVKATPSPAGAEGAATPKEAPHKGKSHLTKAQRAECTIAWRLGTKSPKELAKQYNVTERAMYAFFSRRGIKHGELAGKQVAAAEAASTVDPKIQAQRVKETKDESYKLLTLIRRMVQNEIVKATQAGTKIDTLFGHMRTLKEAAATVKTTREEIYAVLGITEKDLGSDDLPELRISELSAEEIKELQTESESDLDGALAAIEELPPDDNDIELDEEDPVAGDDGP